MEILSLYFCWLLATVFVVAGSMKLASLQQFRSALRSLSIVPIWALPTVAFGVPLAELLVAALLVSRHPLFSAIGAATALLLLSLFIGVSAWVKVGRGTNLECSCFGRLDSITFGWRLIVRNAVLTVPAVWTLFGSSGVTYRVPVSAALTSGLLVVATVFGYVLASSARISHGTMPAMVPSATDGKVGE